LHTNIAKNRIICPAVGRKCAGYACKTPKHLQNAGAECCVKTHANETLWLPTVFSKPILQWQTGLLQKQKTQPDADIVRFNLPSADWTFAKTKKPNLTIVRLEFNISQAIDLH
jgi:hypothetical protein